MTKVTQLRYAPGVVITKAESIPGPFHRDLYTCRRKSWPGTLVGVECSPTDKHPPRTASQRSPPGPQVIMESPAFLRAAWGCAASLGRGATHSQQLSWDPGSGPARPFTKPVAPGLCARWGSVLRWGGHPALLTPLPRAVPSPEGLFLSYME